MPNVETALRLHEKILGELGKAVIGKGDIKEALLTALLAGGHVLIEGAAGSAKTTLAKSFAESIGGEFKRIQFTPDMMPADVTGFYINPAGGQPQLIEGPIFANLVLADELNRTTPRTQSALLEAMQEYQVTVDRDTYALTRPFMVIATQVLAGAEGTYPLTDVQIDRFLLRVASAYSTAEEEKNILGHIDQIDAPAIKPATTLSEVLALQELTKTVQVSPAVVDYIVALVHALRAQPDVVMPPSTRGSIALYKCGRARALLAGRDYVIPDDVKALFYLALEHRTRLRPEAEMEGVTPHQVLTQTLEQVAVPKPGL